MPVLYSEFGVESAIPPAKAASTRAPSSPSPVDEPTQADFYRRALELAACQEGVVGLLVFHSHDEPALAGFQSGVVLRRRDAQVEPACGARGRRGGPGGVRTIGA